MLAQETAIHPGPARRGRTPQAFGNQNAFLGSCLGLLWSENGIEPRLSQVRGLCGPGQRRRTGAAGGPGHAGGGRGGVALAGVGWLAAAPRAGGLVLPRRGAAALESATQQPLAFTIAHPANRLTAGGAAVACLVAARLRRRFMAPRPVAQRSRRKNFCCVTTRRRNFRLLRGLWRRGGTLTARPLGLGVLGFDRLVLTPLGLPLAPPASAGPAAGIRGLGSNAGSNAAAGTCVHSLCAGKRAVRGRRQRQFGLS